jgi:hypothetical protein
MQVFCEPENTGLTATPPQPAMERTESVDFCQVMHANPVVSDEKSFYVKCLPK